MPSLRFVSVVVVEPSVASVAMRRLDGIPVWNRARSILTEAASRSPGVPEVPPVYVVAPPAALPEIRRVLGADTVLDGGAGLPAALRRLADHDPSLTGLVLLDADRPHAPVALATAVHTALSEGAGLCLPLRPVIETLKQVDDDGRVVRTIPRDGVSHLQTPAGISRPALESALRTAPSTATLADLLRLALAADASATILPGDARAARLRPDQPGLSEPADARPASTASTAGRSSG